MSKQTTPIKDPKRPIGRPPKDYPPPFDCTAEELAKNMFASVKPTVSVETKTRRRRG